MKSILNGVSQFLFRIIGSSGVPVEVNSSGQMKVVLDGKVDAANSSIAILGIGGVFPGVACEILDYGIVFVNVYSDVASATDGLAIQQSSDGTNWDHDDVFTIPAGTGKNFSINPHSKYVRVVYTNGGVGQGVFRLQTILKKTNTKPSSHRIQDAISSDDDATLQKSVLTGKDPTGVFRNVNTTEDGDLKISDQSNGLAIAKGDVTGETFKHKFGNAPDFDTSDLELTVWDGAEDATAWEKMVYTYSSTADIDSISSSNASDVHDVVVEGLDTNWAVTSETITLSGQARVPLANNYIRVFRAYNDNSVLLAGHVFVYVNGAITTGIPNNAADIRAIIHPEHQQTEMAVYTIPAGKTGYMRDWYMATSGGNKSSNYVFKLKSREFGKVFRTKHTSAMDALAPIPYQHKYEEPEVFPEKTDIEMTVKSIANPASLENSVSAGFDIVLVDD